MKGGKTVEDLAIARRRQRLDCHLVDGLLGFGW